MSMLSIQIAKLREKARLFEGYQGGEISRMLREAADIIEDLRDRLQNQAFSLGMQEALGSGTCKNLAYYSLINFECSVCGCKVYGGDELGANIENGRWNNCPNCGRKVINE